MIQDQTGMDYHVTKVATCHEVATLNLKNIRDETYSSVAALHHACQLKQWQIQLWADCPTDQNLGLVVAT